MTGTTEAEKVVGKEPVVTKTIKGVTPKKIKPLLDKVDEKKYSEKQLEELVKTNIESERTRLNRVNEDKIADSLERQEKALKKELKTTLINHTQLVRTNAYDAVLNSLKLLFLTKQSNLSLPVITVNEYNKLVQDFASDSFKKTADVI